MTFQRPRDLRFWQALCAEVEAITRANGGSFATPITAQIWPA